MIVGVVCLLLGCVWAGRVLQQHATACGVWVAVVDRRRLVLRVYPDAVTLHCGAEQLARSPISPAQPEGMIAVSLPGSGCRLVVRYAREGDTATAAIWADGVLVAGTLPGPSPALAALLGSELLRQRAVAEVQAL